MNKSVKVTTNTVGSDNNKTQTLIIAVGEHSKMIKEWDDLQVLSFLVLTQGPRLRFRLPELELFTKEQVEEIRLGLLVGIDVTKYASPLIPAEYMAKYREETIDALKHHSHKEEEVQQ